MICRKCTPGCKCAHDECMMAYCQTCAKLCKCWHEGYSIVHRIHPVWVQRLQAGWASSVGWLQDHGLLLLGIVCNIFAAVGLYRLMADFNKELEGVPHEKAIRLGFVILLIAIGLGTSRKS